MSDLSSVRRGSMTAELRDRGYAVVVFTPGELEEVGADARSLEDYLVARGNEWLAERAEENSNG